MFSATGVLIMPAAKNKTGMNRAWHRNERLLLKVNTHWKTSSKGNKLCYRGKTNSVTAIMEQPQAQDKMGDCRTMDTISRVGVSVSSISTQLLSPTKDPHIHMLLTADMVTLIRQPALVCLHALVMKN